MSLVENYGFSEYEKILTELLYEVRAQTQDQIFTGESAIDLVIELQNGARTMIAQQRTSDEDRAAARRAVDVFLDRMVVERDELGFVEFHEITVSGARDFLCPGFWPFC